MEHTDVTQLGALARIALTDEEVAAFQSEMDEILTYVSAVNGITADAGITKQTGAVKNVMRKDVVTNPSGSCADALIAAMPDTKGRHLRVPRILTQDDS